MTESSFSLEIQIRVTFMIKESIELRAKPSIGHMVKAYALD